MTTILINEVTAYGSHFYGQRLSRFLLISPLRVFADLCEGCGSLHHIILPYITYSLSGVRRSGFGVIHQSDN